MNNWLNDIKQKNIDRRAAIDAAFVPSSSKKKTKQTKSGEEKYDKVFDNQKPQSKSN